MKGRWTIRQSAEAAGVSYSALYHWQCRGILPSGSLTDESVRDVAMMAAAIEWLRVARCGHGPSKLPRRARALMRARRRAAPYLVMGGRDRPVACRDEHQVMRVLGVLDVAVVLNVKRIEAGVMKRLEVAA